MLFDAAGACHPPGHSVTWGILLLLGFWVTNLGMVGDHPWYFSPGFSLMSYIEVPNFKCVQQLFLVGDHLWVGG